ncbi:hypothetical protein P154DRAFT_568599 [Amniculicola lignicola CBS 123094]|uniref:Uncharacterized protein n=1 Tax=Amniculicola lignicola CBS 123094 TaxID=1392246 RepID=A0A6A5X4K8_9PLEO|nr:hypothetical protein P154DRAFT_568599 [Amniculicola lignicola CBS 123094]
MKLTAILLLLVAFAATVLAGHPLDGEYKPARVARIPRKCMICQNRLLNCITGDNGLDYDGCEKAICERYWGCDECGFKRENCKPKGPWGTLEDNQPMEDGPDTQEAAAN